LIAPSTYFEDAEKVRNNLLYPTSNRPTVYLLWLRDDYQQGLSLSWSKNLKAKTSAQVREGRRALFFDKRRPAVTLTKREIDRGRNKKVSQKIFYPDHILKPSSNLG